MSIIKVDRQAIIEYSKLDEIAQQVDEKLSKYDFGALVVDEESVKGIKKLRADLGKDFKEFEEARKQIKKAVLAPYEIFNAAYEEKIASKFKQADTTLKTAIDEVETRLKSEKEEQVKEYFNEWIKAKNLDFLTFEKANIKVGLSETIKSLKEQVDNFIDSVDKDIDTILLQKHDKRILARYKKTLDLRGSISSVLDEIEMEESMSAKEEKPAHELKIEPQQVKSEVIEEEYLTVTFTVTARKQDLILLRSFMQERGIKYD